MYHSALPAEIAEADQNPIEHELTENAAHHGPVTAPEVNPAVGRAAALLRADGLAVFPTETVYGLAAGAASTQALSRLAGAMREPLQPPLTWHAPTREALIRAFGFVSPLHRRIVERLTPGPIRLLVEAADPARAYSALGLPAGRIDASGVFAVRVPDHPVARAVLDAAGVTVVAVRTSAAGLGDGRTPPDDDLARARGAGVVVRGGPTPMGRGSTTLRLTAEGGWRFESAGIYDERYIRRRIERTVLFVCTGNTCRSPMAQAIARDILAKAPPLPAGQAPVPTRVLSAGVGASEGLPMTPEAARALNEMGIDPGQHRSREFSRELAGEADAVFVMTQSHLRAVERAEPALRGRVQMLDPDGSEVPDPIGSSLTVYKETAARMRELIVARLAALDDAHAAPGADA